MQLNVVDFGKTITVTVAEARIDAAIAIQFKDKMREIIMAHRKPVLMDLQTVDFMDSSGLGAMIAVHKAMPAGLTLALRGLTPNVDRVFRLTRMDAVFDIRPAPCKDQGT